MAKMHDGSEFKSVYTTGEVARICNISQQTVIRCFDNGRLRGFRVPGSRFRRIPRESLMAFMRHHEIPLDRIDAGPKRVLIVDDDRAVVEMLKDLLQRAGRYEVRVGLTGFEAGMLAQEFNPHVILLDFKLPDVNGTAVCRTLRDSPKMAKTKIIMISGVADPDEVAELMRAGADAFIKKPFDVEEVIEKITALTTE
ncbi:MAG: response regulator [Phycisphaerales bacterium]|nr:response regulator [Phycisphaerales bacterium]